MTLGTMSKSHGRARRAFLAAALSALSAVSALAAVCVGVLSDAATEPASAQERGSAPPSDGPVPAAKSEGTPAGDGREAAALAAECAARRARAALAAGEDAAILVLLPDAADGPPGSNRNTDFEYLCPLRPRTGAILLAAARKPPAPQPATAPPAPTAEPAAAAPPAADNGADRLYILPRNPAMERWTGPEAGPDAATAKAAAFAEVRALDRLTDDLAEIARSRRTLLVSAGPGPLADPWMRKLVAGLRAKLPGRLVRVVDGPLATADDLADAIRAALPAVPAPDLATSDLIAKLASTEIRSARRVLTDLRKTKSASEIALVREACTATVAGIRDALRAAAPGLVERDLAAIVEFRCRQQGCERQSFPSIAGSGPNSCVLHYDRNGRTLAAGDIVVLDVGGERGGYAADVTRSFPVSGKFSPEQAEVYDAVLAAQEAALAVVRPGVTLGDVHDAAVKSLERAQLRRHFIHQTCHSVGLDVHDPWRRDIVLAPGMIITVEPGVYDAARAIGVRIEDTVLVTESGYEFLSAGLPRTRNEVEALMREDAPAGLLAPR